MKNERGFTLIELLVVLAILATLFGITALALSGISSNAEEDLAETELDTVQTALDLCDLAAGCEPVVPPGSTESCQLIGPNTSGVGAYLRRTSHFYYGWDDAGVISQAADSCSGTVYYER